MTCASHDSTEERWQSDWGLFIDTLSRLLTSGEGTVDVGEYFQGKDIEWVGVLTRKTLNGLAPSVAIQLPTSTIKIADQQVTLNSVSVPLADSTLSDWIDVEEGSTVKFSATFGEGNTPFLPVEILELPSGKTALMIRLSDGSLVSIMP